jgi:CxxC motif-containing protein (DUF1111 family)
MQFQLLMRFTDGPQPQPNPSASAARGREVFSTIGCALCHTPTMQTAPHLNSAVLENRPVNLFSDLLVHDMGKRPRRRHNARAGRPAGIPDHATSTIAKLPELLI